MQLCSQVVCFAGNVVGTGGDLSVQKKEMGFKPIST